MDINQQCKHNGSLTTLYSSSQKGLRHGPPDSAPVDMVRRRRPRGDGVARGDGLDRGSRADGLKNVGVGFLWRRDEIVAAGASCGGETNRGSRGDGLKDGGRGFLRLGANKDLHIHSLSRPPIIGINVRPLERMNQGPTNGCKSASLWMQHGYKARAQGWMEH